MLSKIKRKILFPALALLMPGVIMAQAANTAQAAVSGWFDIDVLLLIIAIILLLPIYILGKTMLFSAQSFLQQKKERNGGTVAKAILPIILLLGTFGLHAQDAVVASGTPISVITWLLISVIILETIIIFMLGRYTLDFLRPEAYEAQADSTGKTPLRKETNWFKGLWNKLNKFKSIEEEGEMDTGHEYDGIRELDNVTPPWFTIGFLLTIIFAIVYMWRYQIAKTAPNQIEEFQTEMANAKIQHDEFLKTQAHGIDENSVVLLTAPTDLSAGQTIYKEKCAVCHKDDGGGMVGPNLTDDFWIHGGSIGNIFHTIKYGVPDKGMIAWNDQLSPAQIAEVASYIKSIHGTNPPGAKEPQGDKYVETAAVADSTLTTNN